MSEISLRLSELRDSATRLRLSAQTIDSAVDRVDGIINELYTLGADPVQLTIAGKPSLSSFRSQVDRLRQFADRLDSTATDVELALQDDFRLLPHFALYLLPERQSNFPDDERSAPLLVAGIGADPVYISPANEVLLREYESQRALLDAQIEQRGLLMAQRESAIDDLNATRNRVLSYDPDRDLSTVPRIQAMEDDIARIDAEIAQTDETIARLQASNAQLQERIGRVQPAPGADIALIDNLAGSTTSPQVVANTYDCVNHVVQKLPVPATIAADAHLWNELALSHPEYGITIGDTPLEGAVIVLERDHPYADDVYGHVLYVEYIRDGEVWVSDNLNPSPVRLLDLTTEISGDNVSYLYFPWHTQA